MKRFVLSTLLAITLFFSSCGQLKVFKGADSIPGVQTVYVGGTLLRMGLKSAGEDYAEMGKEFGADVSRLEAIEILNTESKDAVAKLVPFVDKVVKNGKFEAGMMNNDGDEQATIYFSPLDSDRRCDMLIVNREPGEMNVVLLKGIILKDSPEK